MDVLAFSKETDVEGIALLADKTSGILSLRFRNLPDDLNLDPLGADRKLSPSVLSAYLSMGFFLRKAACAYLDVDLSELCADFRVVRDGGKQTGEVFLFDSLENGAGFCDFLFRDRAALRKNLLDVFVDENSKFARELMEHECFLACYDCIQDYGNLHHHKNLNWRLGLDLIHLARDRNSKIDFMLPHWRRFFDRYFPRTADRGCPIVKGADGKVVLLTHPLWSERRIERMRSEAKADEAVPVFRYVEERRGLTK